MEKTTKIKNPKAPSYEKIPLNRISNIYSPLVEDVIKEGITRLERTKFFRPSFFLHQFNVAHLSLEILEKIGETTKKNREILIISSLLHDVGKLFLPEELFFKSKAKLTKMIG